MVNKIKMTQRSVCDSYAKVYRVGYCELQFLLRYLDPIGYNAGVYGWNCDFYLFPNRSTALVTGYRFRHNVPHISYDLCKRYDEMALKIINSDGSYENKREKVNGLVEELFAEFEKTLEK